MFWPIQGKLERNVNWKIQQFSTTELNPTIWIIENISDNVLKNDTTLFYRWYPQNQPLTREDGRERLLVWFVRKIIKSNHTNKYRLKIFHIKTNHPLTREDGKERLVVWFVRSLEINVSPFVSSAELMWSITTCSSGITHTHTERIRNNTREGLLYLKITIQVLVETQIHLFLKFCKLHVDTK